MNKPQSQINSLPFNLNYSQIFWKLGTTVFLIINYATVLFRTFF